MATEQRVPGGPQVESVGRPYRLGPGEGEARSVLGEWTTFKATAALTNGAFAVKEALDRRGGGAPLHVHEREDEACYVVEGELTLVVGDETVSAPAGTWVYLPRGIPHAARVDSDVAKTLWFMVPGGFESFFLATFPRVTEDGSLSGDQPDIALMAEAAARHGVAVLGPPPGSAPTVGRSEP